MLSLFLLTSRGDGGAGGVGGIRGRLREGEYGEGRLVERQRSVAMGGSKTQIEVQLLVDVRCPRLWLIAASAGLS
jgi:hypothetical protein